MQISRQRQGHCLGAGKKDWLQQCGKNTMGIVRVFERPYDYYNYKFSSLAIDVVKFLPLAFV